MEIGRIMVIFQRREQNLFFGCWSEAKLVLVKDGMFRTHVLDEDIIWNVRMGSKVYVAEIFVCWHALGNSGLGFESNLKE